MEYDFLIVGSGLSGSTLAERLSHKYKKILLIDKRSHLGGNVYDEYDKNNVLIHKYGPHIFHTNSKEVFDYLSNFTEWIKYEHKVVSFVDNKFVPIPVNRNTLNLIFNEHLKTDEETSIYLDKLKKNIKIIKSAKDVVLSKIGKELYKKLFEGYTKKQWGINPEKLSPEITKRIPIRINCDDRYFSDLYQYMPKDGYTAMIKKMLSNKKIKILLNTDFRNLDKKITYKNLIYTGPIDYFFNYKYGKLNYRSIYFEFESYNKNHYQNYPVINYPDEKINYTRITEFKYLTGQKINKTTIVKEYPQSKGDEYYPILTAEDKKIYEKYKKEALKLKNTYFVGRLAEFKYYNMDQAVAAALSLSKKILAMEV